MANVTFPKYGEKHMLTPLFDPTHMFKKTKKRVKNIPKKAIFVFSKKVEAVFVRELKLRKDKVLMNAMVNCLAIYRSKLLKNTLVVRMSIGAPIAAVLAEELISFGTKEIVLMGAAGALNRKLDFGNFVICTKAVRDEGTSHHYLKNSVYIKPDKTLSDKIYQIASRDEIKVFRGPTWTIDAPYAETTHEVVHYRDKGIFTVEMEAAAVFAVAKKKKARAAALFTVSDILDPAGWSGFTHSGRIKRKRFAYPAMARIIKALDKT